MSFPTLYLLLAIIGFAGVSVAATRGRRPPSLGALYFIVAWPIAETPLHHIALAMLVSVACIGLGALGHWQGWAGLTLVLLSCVWLWILHRRAATSAAAIEGGLEQALGSGWRGEIAPGPGHGMADGAPLSAWIHPFRVHDATRVERIADIEYGPAGIRNRLDVYRPRQPVAGAPVLLQIHGGAWVFGTKEHQGRPLMDALARAGWICVAPNYRLSPAATFPDHLVDCKLALKWIRENIARFGGDPGFVAVTGGSAGGHLASLLALTPNDPAYQPGFEGVDTRVQAAVPFYGAYDFLHYNGIDIARLGKPGFVELKVMKSSPRTDLDAWRRASPILQVGPHAPPFFVLHGDHDSLVWAEGAREFVAALRGASRQPVAYAELPGAQHAFDILRSVRCEHAVNGVARFLAWVRSRPRAS